MNRSVQYGLIAGIIGVITSLISYLFFPNKIGVGFGIPAILGILAFIITLYLMFKSPQEQKEEQGGFISFKEALKSSFLVTAVSSVVGFVFTLLAKYVLFSDTFDRIMENAINMRIEKMEEKGISDEQIEMSLEMTEKFADMGIWFQLPGALVVGFIIALIIAAIVKKKNPNAQMG